MSIDSYQGRCQAKQLQSYSAWKQLDNSQDTQDKEEINFFFNFSCPQTPGQSSRDNQTVKESAIVLTNGLYFTAYVNGTDEGRKGGL